MLFLVTGIFKPGVEERLLELRDEWNERLSQPESQISLFGVLRDEKGERIGYLAMIEVKDYAEAKAFLDLSPFYQNDLYERVEVAQFDAEVGSVGS